MTDRRIAQRFSVLATLEESKLGQLFWTRDDERGIHALVLLLAPHTQNDDATLQTIVAENFAHTRPTYAWGRDAEGAWLATEAPGEQGVTLDAVLRRRDRLELTHLLRLAVGLARAVQDLVQAGAAHLDISPGRVWLPTGTLTAGAPLLFGAGWWRLLPAYHNGAAQETFYGNPEYLAAELCKGLAPNPTTDVYGAATTIWALAAGKPPFPSNQPLMALKRQAVEKPLRLDLVKPALQGIKDLQALLVDALDKDPAKRPSAETWRAQVEALAGQKAPEALDQTVALQRTVALESPAQPVLPEKAITTETSAPTETSASPEKSAPTPTDSEAPTEAPTAGGNSVAAKPVSDPDAATLRLPTLGAATPLPSADLASLPDAQEDEEADTDADAGEADDGTEKPRQGKRRRERRERQTVAGIGIAAALAERNLAEANAASGPAQTLLGGLNVPRPDSQPISQVSQLDGGVQRDRPSGLTATAGAAQKIGTPSESQHDKTQLHTAVPPRPNASGPDRVIVRQPPVSSAKTQDAKTKDRPETKLDRLPGGESLVSQAAVSPTDRVKAELAQGAFFEDEGGVVTDLADQMPPTPPTEKVNRKALLAILGFAALMLGLSVWMTLRQPTAENEAKPPEEPAQAEALAEEPSAAVAEAEPATTAAAVVEAVPVAVAPTPAAATPENTANLGEAAAVPAVPAPGADAAANPQPVPLQPKDDGRFAEVQRLVDEGRSSLATKDPVTALAKAQQALALNAGHAPAVLLREEASRAVEAAAVEARAIQAKAAEAQAAAAKAEAARVEAEEQKARNDGKKNEALKKQAEYDRVQHEQEARDALALKHAATMHHAANAKAEKAAEKAEKLAAAKEAAAHKAAQAKAEAKEKKERAEEKKERAEKAKSERATPPTPAERPSAQVRAPTADEGGTQDAVKFAALAQKASKAKLKVLYLQKALKLDPNNAGYKTQLKAAEEQLKAEGP